MYSEMGAVAFISAYYPQGTFAYLVKQYRERFAAAYAARNVKLEEICYQVVLHTTIAALEAAKSGATKKDAQGCMYELLLLFQHTTGHPDLALRLLAAQRSVTSGMYDQAINYLHEIENIR
jgi:hypothetical protein